MSEEEKRKLILDNISKEALVDRVNEFFVREKYYRERTYDLENIIDKAIEQIEIAQYNLSYNKNCINKDLQDLLEILGDKENEQ